MTIHVDAAGRHEGWRERKRRQTRERIAGVGLRLFLERGFEETTLDAIAEQAEVARRTFFHYFDSKEAILASLQDAAELGMRTAILQADPARPPFEVVYEAMVAMVSGFGSEEARAIDRLLRSTEALRARKQANYEAQERMIFATLSEKWPAPDLALRLKLVALACVGALRLAADLWSTSEDRPSLQVCLSEMFATLRGDITT